MKTIVTFIAVGLIHVTSGFSEGPRQWTNVDGKQIQATLRSASTTDVTVVLPNGRMTDIPLSKLSQGDQTYVNEWLANTAKRAQHFGIDVLGVKIGSVANFLQANSPSGLMPSLTKYEKEARISPDGRVSGGGKVIGRSVLDFDGELYSVELNGDDVMVEIKAKMTPPTKPGASPKILDVKNLFLIYVTDNKVEDKAIVRPRWLPSDKTKMGRQKDFTLDDAKGTEIGVGFIVPARAVPTALFYKGAVEFEVPLR